jgi:hypothetical protein
MHLVVLRRARDRDLRRITSDLRSDTNKQLAALAQLQQPQQIELTSRFPFHCLYSVASIDKQPNFTSVSPRAQLLRTLQLQRGEPALWHLGFHNTRSYNLAFPQPHAPDTLT